MFLCWPAPQGTYTGVRPSNTEMRRGKQRQTFAGVQYAVLPAARREACFPVASDKGGWKEPFQAYVRAGAWRGGLSRNIRILVG